jgi:hypothetical protein
LVAGLFMSLIRPANKAERICTLNLGETDRSSRKAATRQR